VKLTGETKFFFGIILATLGIVFGAVFLMSKPAPTFTRENLLPTDAHAIGNASASAYLVEFSDFQCPSCKAVKPIVDKVVQQYKDRLIFGYRHFPLDQHPFAVPAALAAEAADKQGKFWEMYDALFAGQEKLSDSFILETATSLGLDISQFNSDLANAALKDKVEKDRTDGLRFGVDATPTFYLNGKKLILTSFNDLEKEVVNVLQ